MGYVLSLFPNGRCIVSFPKWKMYCLFSQMGKGGGGGAIFAVSLGRKSGYLFFKAHQLNKSLVEDSFILTVLIKSTGVIIFILKLC